MYRLADSWMEDSIAVLFVTKQMYRLADAWMEDIIALLSVTKHTDI